MTKEETKKRIKLYKNCIKEDEEEIKELKKVKLTMFHSPSVLIKQREKRIKKALYFIKKLEKDYPIIIDTK